MSSFDIIINIIEAFCYCLFIFLVLDKNKKFQYLFLFIFIFFINMSIFNYYLFPEILLTITNFLILFIYSHYLNKNEPIQNLFLVLVGNRNQYDRNDNLRILNAVCSRGCVYEERGRLSLIFQP